MDDPPAPVARGSRKFAVSLFADLTGYTALCERLDPEDVERAIVPLMTGMQSAVESESGVVLNVAGDGLFAMFGVPNALPDSPLRAVRTAQAMRGVVAELVNQVEGLALPDVHIGIAAGEVLLTPTPQGTWSVIGTSVNLASRLCDAAKAGEVLVEDSCQRLVPETYGWEDARRLSLKGQDRETIAWPLSPDLIAPSSVAVPRVFVGRSSHLAALDSELEATAATGVSRTVLVRGVAGIGKSSLVEHWLATHPELPRWQVECDEARRHDDLLVLSDVIEDHADGGIVNAPAHPALVDRADPHPMVVHALRTSLKKATTAPRMLLVENLHVSDTALAEFLIELSRDPLDAPLLVVATWRDESSESKVGPGLLGLSLRLQPLDRAETDSLIDELLGESVDAATLEVISTRTHGHPLMVRESAIHLVDLRASSGEAPSAQSVQESLPTSVRMFLAARIDRLDPVMRAVVHDLSALGARFTAERVGDVLGRRAEDTLPALSRAGILVEEAHGWSFTHDLMREVAYGTLTRAHRADLHKRQLDLLRPDADLYERADNALAWNEAVSPVDRENYAASTVAAVRETLGLARQIYERHSRAALEAARRATSAARDCLSLDPSVTAQLWALEAQCLSELGRNDDALSRASQADRAAAEANLPALRLAPLMTRGYVLSTLRRFETARQSLDEAARLAAESGDLTSQAAAIQLLADTWRHSLIGRYIALTEEAYNLFETAHDRRGAGQCARTLAYECSVGGLARFMRWRDIAEGLTDSDDVRSTATLAKADALALGGRFDFAGYVGAGSTLVSAGEALEAPDLLSEGLLNLSDAYLHVGAPSLARDASLRLIDLATTQSDRRMRATAAAAAGQPLLRMGQLARSHEELQVAREMARDFGGGEEAFVSSVGAACLADRGAWGDSLGELRATLDVLSEIGFTLGALGTRAAELRIVAATDADWPRAAADDLLADALDLEAPLVASYVLALDAWARAARGEVSELVAAPDKACIEELALRADTAALHRDLDGHDPALWHEARTLWQQLGYTVWLARAQARSGDVEAARHTLDVLDSPAEARAWALGDAAAS